MLFISNDITTKFVIQFWSGEQARFSAGCGYCAELNIDVDSASLGGTLVCGA